MRSCAQVGAQSTLTPSILVRIRVLSKVGTRYIFQQLPSGERRIRTIGMDFHTTCDHPFRGSPGRRRLARASSRLNASVPRPARLSGLIVRTLQKRRPLRLRHSEFRTGLRPIQPATYSDSIIANRIVPGYPLINIPVGQVGNDSWIVFRSARGRPPRGGSRKKRSKCA